MDSVTHIVLGAAIGEAFLGKKIGRRAALAGAFLKTFPDFDLFISGLTDPKKYIIYHRAHTHAFFIELLYAIPLAALMYLLFKRKQSFGIWFAFTLTCLWMHSFVDVFTNYGTRLFLPFTKNLYSLNTIAIADLFLTIPILITLIIALIYKNNSAPRTRLMNGILIYASIYFGLTAINKTIVDSKFKKSISENKFNTKKYMSNPVVLSNFLWYANVMEKDTLRTAFYGSFQPKNFIAWKSFPTNDSLLKAKGYEKDIELLNWFSQGFYLVDNSADTLKYTVAKFGPNTFNGNCASDIFEFYYMLYPEKGKIKLDFKDPSKSKTDASKMLKEMYDASLGRQYNK